MQTRFLIDRSVKYLLLASALVSIFVVFLIGLFTLQEGWEAFQEIGLGRLLTGQVWRPQREEYGLLPMIVGSVYATIGAMVLGVPFALGSAVFLAEIAPPRVRSMRISAGVS